MLDASPSCGLAPELAVSVAGDEVVVDIRAAQPIYGFACGRLPVGLQRFVEGDWKPLRDERPGTHHDGYYLDDAFVQPENFETCHLPPFIELPVDDVVAGRLVERLKVGSREPPESGAADSGPALEVPVFETRAFAGRARVWLQYSYPGCGPAELATQELEARDE